MSLDDDTDKAREASQDGVGALMGECVGLGTPGIKKGVRVLAQPFLLLLPLPLLLMQLPQYRTWAPRR